MVTIIVNDESQINAKLSKQLKKELKKELKRISKRLEIKHFENLLKSYYGK